MTEREAIVAWLRGRPFPWPQPTPILSRLKTAWHIPRYGDKGFQSVFTLLALKIQRGDHLSKPEQD